MDSGNCGDSELGVLPATLAETLCPTWCLTTLPLVLVLTAKELEDFEKGTLLEATKKNHKLVIIYNDPESRAFGSKSQDCLVSRMVFCSRGEEWWHALALFVKMKSAHLVPDWLADALWWAAN